MMTSFILEGHKVDNQQMIDGESASIGEAVNL